MQATTFSNGFTTSSNGFPPPGGRLPPLMMNSPGNLNMELVKAIQNQQQCLSIQQEAMIKNQEMIYNMTQQLLGIKNNAPKPPGSSKGLGPKPLTSMAPGGKKMRDAACLGVVRLDYDYPASPGDIDCPESFGYDVFYRVVPGLTFGICQAGKLTKAVEKEFIEAIGWMDGKGVSGITGDCGFMMYFQQLARSHTYKPVFMSSLAQLPAVTCGYASNELIAVLTANGATLKPMRALIRDECGVDTEAMRYIFVGCQDVPGFEAVALGEKVDVQKVTPGVVQHCKDILTKYPKVRAFLLECTELPPYSDAIRAAFGLPVYDSITCCNFFISGEQDNKRFGISNWQKDWDGEQATYTYGANLSYADKQKLINKTHDF